MKLDNDDDDLLAAIDMSGHPPTDESGKDENGPIIGSNRLVDNQQFSRSTRPNPSASSIDCRFVHLGCLRRFKEAMYEQLHAQKCKFRVGNWELPLQHGTGRLVDFLDLDLFIKPNRSRINFSLFKAFGKTRL
ncbi:MAG: hypothetical protein MHMPM18_004291 [Marteilia pararefringens]